MTGQMGIAVVILRLLRSTGVNETVWIAGAARVRVPLAA